MKKYLLIVALAGLVGLTPQIASAQMGGPTPGGSMDDYFNRSNYYAMMDANNRMTEPYTSHSKSRSHKAKHHSKRSKHRTRRTVRHHKSKR